MTAGISLTHIVATAENRAIGHAGAIPWHIPEDFKFFKAVTTGHAMIMGRKTFESIGRPLPGRLSIVVTRQKNFVAAGTEMAPVEVVGSIDAATALAARVAERWGREVFVIGGAEIYAATLPLADKVHQTLVPKRVEGDAFYPELPEGEFDLVSTRLAEGPEPCVFQTFARRGSGTP